jgi:DNA-nicking Smr family endonuclease
MGYINKIDEKEKDRSKVVGARVSEDVLTALSMAEADSERFGYSISVTEIIKQALNDTLNEINQETKIDYYKLTKWLKKIKKVYFNVSRYANVGIEHDPIFDDFTLLEEPNLKGNQSVRNNKDTSFMSDNKIFSKMLTGKIGDVPSINLNYFNIDGIGNEENYKSLSRFIHHSSEYQFMHIIHGKGGHSDNGFSILKSQVVNYLDQHPKVLAYCSCPEEMGGTGALYIHLKPSPEIEFQLDEFSKDLREDILAYMKSGQYDFENALMDQEQSLFYNWNQRLNDESSFVLTEKGELSIKPGSTTTL